MARAIPAALALAFGCTGVAEPEPFDLRPSQESVDDTELGVASPVVPAYRVEADFESGSIVGRVRFRGMRPHHDVIPVPRRRDVCGSSHLFPAFRVDATGGLADAVVYVERIEAGKRWPENSTGIVFDEQGCQLSPHVHVAGPVSEVSIHNHDETIHSLVGEFAGGVPWFHFALPHPGSVRAPLPPQTGVARVDCTAGHPWEFAFIHVFEHPYAVVTKESGTFELTEVPVGRHQIMVRHAGAATEGSHSGRASLDQPLLASVEVEVRAGEILEVEFDLSNDPTPGGSSSTHRER